MSKVIKSAFENSSYRLEVGKYVGAKHTSLWIIGGGDHAETIAIADKDIPSLMLALGEAAGYVPKWDSWSENGTPEHLAHIQWHLAKYAEAQAAQAEEAAKLEAEAVELYNAGARSFERLTTLDNHPELRDKWIAVARKARELGGVK